MPTGLRWSIARDRLRKQVAEDVRRQREDAGGAPTDAETAKVARSPAVARVLDAVWPALTAPACWPGCATTPDFLRRCSAATLTDDERARSAPARRRSRCARSRWTPADAVLLDELDGLLRRRRHVRPRRCVDEAQDLSAMQCRAVARRCPLGSVTVLGDLAQATTPVGAG